IRIDTNKFGVAAVEPGITEKDPIGTRGLVAAAAMPAIAADMAVGRGGHGVAASQASHALTELFDRAGHLVTEDDRQAYSAPERSIAHHDIVEADAAGGN